MFITDAQAHIWGEESPDRPWVDGGKARAHRPTPWTAEEVLAEMDAAGVDRCLLVPPSWQGDRNDLALAAARAWPDRFAVMGRVTIDDPDAFDLATWLEQPGMLGVRIMGLGAEWFWEAVGKYDIPVMTFAPGSSTELGALARRYPDVRITADHCNIPLGSFEIDRYVDELLPLAELANVTVKLSALPCYVEEGYPFGSLGPHVRRVVDAFGAERCMWGSDLSRLPCPYTEWVDAMSDGLGVLSAPEVEWIMGKSIAHHLRWPEPTAPRGE
jgi:predicted TIM-barrel fold metal-dependent hydrolase